MRSRDPADQKRADRQSQRNL